MFGHLLESGYFRNYPHFAAGAESLLAECHAVVNRYQSAGDEDSSPDTELVNYATAARLLGVSKSTVHRRVRDGVIVPVRLNGAVRFRRRDLVDYLEAMS